MYAVLHTTRTHTHTRHTRRALTDADGVTVAEASAAAGLAPEHLGRDDEALGRVGLFIELHVEQGRGLIDLGIAAIYTPKDFQIAKIMRDVAELAVRHRS